MRSSPGAKADADTVTAAWLRKRHPAWDDEDIRLQLTRTHVIDEYPHWPAGQVDMEALRRMAAEDGHA
jgi:hypothetical protein